MLNFTQITFKSLALHRVGNKLREEGVLLADDLYNISDETLRNVLLDYFLSPFKNADEFFKFSHDTKLELNEVYNYCQQIFADTSSLFAQSINISKHLYNQSTHPKVRSGEFYVAYFSDCVLDDEIVDAIGIFKSENKDTYLKPIERNNEVIINYESGINVRKLDKGCLIFNTSANEGYRMLVIDKQSKGSSEAQYWRDDFLHTERVHDRAFTTQNYIQLCSAFCDEISPEMEGKKEEVLFMSKSINYFAEHDNFDVEDFAETVLEEGSRIVEFKKFKEQYETENGLEQPDLFQISQPMVKQMKRKFKNQIQLDTGIELKLSGESADPYIIRGYDEERKMFFYKVFFTDEA